MIDPSTVIGTASAAAAAGNAKRGENAVVADSSVDFSDALVNAISQASAAETASVDAAKRFADGDPSVGIHEVMIAAEKASVTLKYAVTIKNKIISAYQDLMSTQI